MWFFFLRYWRKWIILNKSYTLVRQLSSDRRFRVRIKQLFFSSETIVSTSASSGMLDCDKLRGSFAVNKCASDTLNNECTSSKVVTESSSVIDLIDIPSDGDGALDDTWVNV